MAKMKALRDFGGSTINREDLGNIQTDQEIEVSSNDAAYLEREGYAERVEEPAPAAADNVADNTAAIDSGDDTAAKAAADGSTPPADLQPS